MPSPDISKSAQVAGRLLTLAGGQMVLSRLGVLLYVVDRSALGRWGRPVAFSSYVAASEGPEPGPTFEHLFAGSCGESGWECIIPTRGGQRVRLEASRGYDQISEAEEDLISEVHLEYDDASTGALLAQVNRFPELNELPDGSAFDIGVPDMLTAQGYSTQEVEAVTEELGLFKMAKGVH